MSRSAALLSLAATAVLALAVVLFYVLPPRIVTDADITDQGDRAKARNDIRTAGVQLLGVLGLLAGGALTARTIQVSREGQITDRFTKAIDQLGSTKLEVRLGGIYALERVARDSERDQGSIMEVLTAYIRERSSWTNTEVTAPASPPPTNRSPVPIDIHAAFTVVARRGYQRDKRRLDLTKCDMHGVIVIDGNFSQLDLDGSNLSDSSLIRADFREAYLTGSSFCRAYLRNARFERAVCRSVDFREASLQEASFLSTHIEDAMFDDRIELPSSLDDLEARGARRV